MPPASRRQRAGSAGFSLTEALVAAVVLGVALVGSSGALQGITGLVQRSSDQNARELAIDNDISEIKRLASLYTACVVPTGSFPSGASAGCGLGLAPDQAAYYFPVDPGVNEANITAFFQACKSAAAQTHITQGFITAISGLGEVGAGVQRTTVAREAPTDYANHNVIVRYQTTDASIQRLIKVAPVLSSWCD